VVQIGAERQPDVSAEPRHAGAGLWIRAHRHRRSSGQCGRLCPRAAAGRRPLPLHEVHASWQADERTGSGVPDVRRRILVTTRVILGSSIPQCSSKRSALWLQPPNRVDLPPGQPSSLVAATREDRPVGYSTGNSSSVRPSTTVAPVNTALTILGKVVRARIGLPEYLCSSSRGSAWLLNLCPPPNWFTSACLCVDNARVTTASIEQEAPCTTAR